GFSNIGQIIPEKLKAHGVDPTDIPEGAMEKISGVSYSDIQANIAQIPSEKVRLALEEAFNEAAHQAYEPIYIATGMMAFLIIVLSILFHQQFKQDAREEERTQD